ncbi:MAG: hypothetical protein SWQ30_20310 [Thermodesulfobacteriota bacterium]|nr:hypothetical protein [Thermodesulfobacteriota bacterium]
MPKQINMFTVVCLFVLTFSGLALASPPVPPPVEGFGISTACDVELAGDLSEEEGFTWTYVDADESMNNVQRQRWDFHGFPHSSVDPLYLAIGGSAAQVRYTEELDSVDSSLTQFKRTFVAQSDDAPNVKVGKDLGYVASGASLIAYAEDKERVGLGIVSYGSQPDITLLTQPNEEALNVPFAQGGPLGGGANGGWGDPPLEDIPSLCPWAGGEIPATNEFIAAGSSIATTSQMVSHTDTDMTSTGPPELSHSISAQGAGTAAAQMRVQLMEGDGSVNADVDPGGGTYDFVIPNLVSETVYDEKTSATGVIDKFSKAMHYHSTIPSWQLPEPWYELQ